MRKPDRTKAWGRIARVTALGASVLLLAGCATGYSFVQPEVAGSGGYYTSAGPYSSQGYYDYYGTGPYYPGTSGWGYYNGTSPYSGAYGWYGGYYGGYGYWPQLTLGIGISNVWDFPGYWGPWYSTGFPIWSCPGRGCGDWRHRRHHHGYHDRHDHRSSDPSPKVVLEPERPPVPLRIERGGNPAIAVPARPLARRQMEGFATRRPFESTAFATHDFVRAPIQRPVEGTRFNEVPARPIYVPRVPEEPAFANRRGMTAPAMVPHETRPIAQRPFQPQPMRVAPVVSSPSHHARATKTEIP